MRSKVTSQQFDAEVVKLAEVADRARDLALQKVARMRRFRGAAAVREMARLRARDGPEAATTIGEASKMLGRARTLTRLREDLKTVALGTRVKRDRTLVFGKLVARGGRPATGTRVAVTTDTGRAVGEAVADDAGLFMVKRPRDFDRLVEGARALVVVVRDATGRELHKSSMPVRGTVVLTLDLSKRESAPRHPGGPPASPGLLDIRGLGEARIARLTESGIRDVADLTRMNPDDLASLLRVSATQARDLIRQARRLRS